MSTELHITANRPRRTSLELPLNGGHNALT